MLPEPVRRVRLSVQDRSSVWPHRRSPGEAATSGRGLLMIEALADAWGVEPRGDGKAVWCEFGPAADARRETGDSGGGTGQLTLSAVSSMTNDVWSFAPSTPVNFSVTVCPA